MRRLVVDAVLLLDVGVMEIVVVDVPDVLVWEIFVVVVVVASSQHSEELQGSKEHSSESLLLLSTKPFGHW